MDQRQTLTDSLFSCFFASSTKDITILFFVRLTNQVLPTASAGKVMRMIFISSSIHTLVAYCLFAVVTARAK
jgi:hypothetical protein